MRRPMTRPSAAIVVTTIALAMLAGVRVAAAADEGDLLRQIKSDVFDQKWQAVLDSCGQFVAEFPHSEALPRAYYYRAQALEHLKGREAEAITAYTDFLTRFPGETGAIKEDALLSRMTLAGSQWLKGDRAHVGIILKGMQERGYPRLYAAIQASKIDHGPARAAALPILKDCASAESDVELKNECVVALLRIDPKALGALASPGRPGGPPSPPRPPGAPPPPAGGEVKLIRVEVFDAAKNQVVVRVNLPIAFAELLLDSLGQAYREEIQDHLKQKGIIDLEKFWQAIKAGGKQTILEFDDGQERIKVWVE